MNRLLLALSMLLTVSVASGADALYVQSAKAKIMSTPAFDATVLATADKGDALALVEKSGSWLKVAYRQHTGWVSALLVSDKPPRDKITVIKDVEDKAQKDNVRRRASASASAAAARGLRQDERARLSDEGQANYEALEKVEAARPDDADVGGFGANSGK
jgi:uncharacterized protein YgiM (DUF1202 family)